MTAPARVFIVAAVAAVVACASACAAPVAPSLAILGRLPVRPPACAAPDPDAGIVDETEVGTLDLGAGEDAFAYVAPLRTESTVAAGATAPSVAPIAVVASTSFLTGADGAALTAPAKRGVAGTVFNESVTERAQTFVTLVDVADALALRGAFALATPGDRARVDVHVTLTGVVYAAVPPPLFPRGPGDDGDDGALATTEVASNELVVPLDLCRGCLVPSCAAGERLAGDVCFLGVDDPARCDAIP